MEYLFLLVPVVLVTLTVINFGLAFRQAQKVNNLLFFIGFLAFTLLCVYIGWLSSVDDLGSLFAFMIILMASGTFLIFCVGLAIRLLGKRKILVAILAVIFPVALFLSFQIGNTFSPESISKANGTRIEKALEQFHTDYGTYPQTLFALAPHYLTVLRAPNTSWGWLYQATENDYSLGFVANVDGWHGYSIFLHRANSLGWNYIDSSGPFRLGPTPAYFPYEITPSP